MNPTNGLVTPMLTDKYELTMAYGYWKLGRHETRAAFDLHFRRNPFGGEFTIFAGLEEVLRLVSSYRFTDRDIELLKPMLPVEDKGFFEWLRNIDCSTVTIRALPEGSVTFPRVPMMVIEGPIAVTQLLETGLINLVNYASLVATNAARMKLAAGEGKSLLEFGLRRAQGPDGAVSASRYSYIGGFDGTSNVAAAASFGIPSSGTTAHSWVLSFSELSEVDGLSIAGLDGKKYDFLRLVKEARSELGFTNTNDDELASFVGYAVAWPDSFLALVDTYDTVKSGVPNFLSVALALARTGHRPLGIRLDSGDLAYLSKEARRMFRAIGEREGVDFSKMAIVASNDIDEETLLSLRTQGHEVDVFGIGTKLVTAVPDGALGCVYKLVEMDGRARMKLSQDLIKVTIPGPKSSYRLLGEQGKAILDLMMLRDEPAPEPGRRILCRHPFNETARVYVTPSAVVPMYSTVWNGELGPDAIRPIEEVRERVAGQLSMLREDHLRAVNPTPYKVSVSERLYDYLHELWSDEAPIKELR
ncbi:MAG TPA: nicotinate phosphoribosyltransferase [Chloroflexota bacterium]